MFEVCMQAFDEHTVLLLHVHVNIRHPSKFVFFLFQGCKMFQVCTE